jgi:hypothetical protein
VERAHARGPGVVPLEGVPWRACPLSGSSRFGLLEGFHCGVHPKGSHGLGSLELGCHLEGSLGGSPFGSPWMVPHERSHLEVF